MTDATLEEAWTAFKAGYGAALHANAEIGKALEDAAQNLCDWFDAGLEPEQVLPLFGALTQALNDLREMRASVSRDGSVT